MRRTGLVFIIVVVAVALGIWYARQRLSQTNRIVVPTEDSATSTGVPAARTDDGAVVQEGCEDIAAAVRSVLLSSNAIPKGVRLASLSLEGKKCVIGLSAEISAVNDLGSTGESESQNAFRAALARFDRVETMRVTVDGGTFEGSHSGEWDDIPVRGGPTAQGADS